MRRARADALYGSWLCGYVLVHVGMALHHKLCHTLGGSFDLPHPAAYTLGKGHLQFFYTRLGYFTKRHAELIREMPRRGYKPAFFGVDRHHFPEISEAYWSDWDPPEEAVRLNRQRIEERSGKS